MALQKLQDGAFTDITGLRKYSSTEAAWTDCECANKYADGAWQEVWGSSIEPIGVYVQSANHSVSITDDDIVMELNYGNQISVWGRIIVPLDSSDGTVKVSMDSILVTGIDDTNYTISVTLYESNKIYTGTFTSTGDQIALATVYSGTSADSWADNNYSVDVSASKSYLYLQFALVRKAYNSSYSGNKVKLYISGLRVNGKKIVGNMATS